MNQQEALLSYTLQLADNALIIGHRMSEWCGHGPILEQDIAITNMALDHLGQARSFYQYAADQFNQLPEAEKNGFFTSISLQQGVATGRSLTEDDLAYLRDGWDFRNVLLNEQPNIDWAYTVTRSFYYDAFNYFFYTALQSSSDVTLAAIAEKSLKEVTYHLRWSSEWMIRLGDGTEESHEKMQNAVNDLWSYTGELFKTTEAERMLTGAGTVPDMDSIRSSWEELIGNTLDEATLAKPAAGWMQEGGKEGRHSEHLGYILTELQFMQRTYPAMEW